MASIKRESITEQVYEILQRDIEAGRIKPGARISEEVVARELGISKTPLRLALYQLKQDGIVRIEPRRGIYLAVPTATELLELIEMREVLEGLAARRATGQPDKRFIARLKDCFAGFREQELADSRPKYATADHQFHTLLVRASGSRELVKTMKIINMRLHINRVRGTLTRGHDLRPIHREHLDIIAAIEAGDASLAETRVRSHVRHQLWLTMLKDRGSAGSGADRSGVGDALALSDDQ
jgi:DNA-binding GntR family transcriptional regulator